MGYLPFEKTMKYQNICSEKMVFHQTLKAYCDELKRLVKGKISGSNTYFYFTYFYFALIYFGVYWVQGWGERAKAAIGLDEVKKIS